MYRDRCVEGKEEYAHTIRYYDTMIKKHSVQLHLNTRVTADELIQGGYDEIILATGVSPRQVDFEGADHPKVLSYVDVLYKKVPVGKSVAIVGAGGIWQTLAASFSRYDYGFSLAILMTIVSLVFLGEFFSNWIRAKLR